jgi:uncharacterized protein YecT (DUF1311 family)
MRTLMFSAALILAASSSPAQVGLGQPVYKTSFDCAKAQQQSTEEVICLNADLAKLDLEMAAAYRNRLASSDATQRDQVVSTQRTWLIVRNFYKENRGEPAVIAENISELYRMRIAALRSDQISLLTMKLPPEYEWLKSAATWPSKDFSFSWEHMGCQDPCSRKPAFYKVLSVSGAGTGEPPGDVDTPYDAITKKLAAEGWTKCRSADDSGKPDIDYFAKKDKMISVFRNYSMGAGNAVGLSITISDPLPEVPPQLPPSPDVRIASDWLTYSAPDVGLTLRYPPNWRMRDDSPTTNGAQYKYLSFSGADYSGDFRVSVEPEEKVTDEPLNINQEDPPPKCAPSHYRISGHIAEACVAETEVVGSGTCDRHVESLDAQTGKYRLIFAPVAWGSFADDSGQYKLTDLYEKILSTIEIN